MHPKTHGCAVKGAGGETRAKPLCLFFFPWHNRHMGHDMACNGVAAVRKRKFCLHKGIESMHNFAIAMRTIYVYLMLQFMYPTVIPTQSSDCLLDFSTHTQKPPEHTVQDFKKLQVTVQLQHNIMQYLPRRAESLIFTSESHTHTQSHKPKHCVSEKQLVSNSAQMHATCGFLYYFHNDLIQLGTVTWTVQVEPTSVFDCYFNQASSAPIN